jgi:SecD/SecF fusion protein
MISKNVTIILTVLITLLCIYYLSFTFVSRSIDAKATAASVDSTGNINFSKKQQYLDSIWNEPVYNLLGIKYTYKEIKDIELGLGLDLQGGMHVTLEISPVDILRALSGNSEDPVFNKALVMAREKQRNSQDKFTSLFYQSFKELNPNGKLSTIFANASNRGKISFESSDNDILKVIDKEVDDAIDRSFQIITNRIDQFGTSSPNIQRLPVSGRLQVELPGVENRARVRNLLQGVAKLEFWEVYDLNQAGNVLMALNSRYLTDRAAQLKLEKSLTGDSISVNKSNDNSNLKGEAKDLAKVLQGQPVDTAAEKLASKIAGDSTKTDSTKQSQTSPLFSLRRSPYYGLFYPVKDTSKINRIIQNPGYDALIPNSMKFLWMKNPTKDDKGEDVLELYALRVRRGGVAPLTGEVIVDARSEYDEHGRPSVSMQMNTSGAKAWRKLTAENVNHRIAIVLDNKVYSAPNVINEIPNGNSSITGNFSLDETKDLANVLKTGKLPAPTRIVEEAVIGPTLGRQAQMQGILSVIAGLGAVIIFMVAYYSKGGFVANLALIFNVFFVLGILAQMNAALTLPGIAGIVLTMGMAVDANVLIFERIREELRNGTSYLNAISHGYTKAWATIIDTHVTGFLTAMILYLMGQGPVRGFATTLMIGIVCSIFTAVFISRVIILWITKNGEKQNVSFEMRWSKNILIGKNYDFMGTRKIAYIFSGIMISVGIALIIFQGGMNFGVDFTGGRSYVVMFDKPVSSTDLRDALAVDFKGAGTEVKTYGSSNAVKVTTSYLVEDESSHADTLVENTMIRGIEAKTGLKYQANENKFDAGSFIISGSSKVGATIADDIQTSSMWAVILAWGGIFLYIVFRFRKWQYGMGAVVSLIHDTLFVIVSFGYARLFGKVFDVDQVFIAAVLTVIGYSINDTVVVFDRVREHTALKPGTPLVPLLNESINSTLSRTIITSGCTLLSVLVLLFFGGEVLRGFSFALTVGVVMGTYSSVWVAMALVLDFYKIKTGKKAVTTIKN